MLRSGAGHPDAGHSAASTSRQRSPEEEAQHMYATLNEYLLLEHKSQPKLCLPAESENGEVTTGARDGAAHVLRCLKVWYDLPADVLISAINLFDRFLTKMKVRPCHVPCITVSCMNIALEQYAADTDTKRSISVEELVSISQSACTAGDVLRMSRVIVDKLSLVAGCRVVTALDWLRLLRSMLMLQADHLGVGLPAGCQEDELVQMLEIVSCDAACVNTRTSELALVLLYYKLEQQLAEWSANEENMIPEEHAYYLFDFARQVQLHCQMNEASLVAARARVRHVVSRYERCEARRDRQRLVWRLSERTLKVLRPTDRLTSLLPTIEEQHFAVDATPTRTRSGSVISETEEETSDWPRSPVLPVYCDN
ncbi:cyclin G [Spodoptera frugiperda]|uniref:Cyclin G n=1 Tax=Spodoptera frugiperda TaxID=7108 RepID=A0A9R0ESZ0_SPOFR|nr:cyclin G [Spodoptera frugiperda]XP_035457671.1 cyclin G [Spodoptera frugiperda]